MIGWNPCRTLRGQSPIKNVLCKSSCGKPALKGAEFTESINRIINIDLPATLARRDDHQIDAV